MIAVTLLQFALVVGVVVYLTLNMLHLERVQPEPTPAPPSSPLVSVCVPVRNEERNVEACLVSLMRQDYPRFEVIAVDDNSTDATPRILRSLAEAFPGLTHIEGAPLPQGWYGKLFALHQACRQARGSFLLFTDADPVFQPQALSSAMFYMKECDLDVLTLMPGSRFGSFWEKTVQPVVFAFIAALTRFKKVNSPDYPDAMGIGAFILIKRSVYERIGGHERVKQKIVEDIELAKCAKREGFKLAIADGKAIFSIRMYYSLKEIWQGWNKNIFVALKKSVPRTLGYMFAILSFQVASYVVLFYNVWVGSSVWLTLLSLAGAGLVLVTGRQLCVELQLNPRNALLFPLGAVAMAAIMVNSMIQVLCKGRVEWRDRTYFNS